MPLFARAGGGNPRQVQASGGTAHPVQSYRHEHGIHEPAGHEELRSVVADGWAKAYWCGDSACEARIKDDTRASSRNIPLDQGDAGPGLCIVCGKQAKEWAYWARAY